MFAASRLIASIAMTLHFLFLGRTRRPECRSLFEDYAARIRRSADVRFTELREPTESALARVKTDSAARWILLDAVGHQYSSPEFARWLGKLRDRGARELIFLCGGDAGFPESFRARAHESLSLSPLTMPHELARVVLAEQLYRAFAILSHHPYAK
ncbi:MAG TPA: 23S rRNA (pseudouridine(1915)-N(3))-methyltransferase RlmH [Candidatus Acidoferrales bacterium]|nr:23S rRNA (pseudouridine(1915)-N(3))-methyltransferase RlmH [Candidatus Acidoferrales bacterium]